MDPVRLPHKNIPDELPRKTKIIFISVPFIFFLAALILIEVFIRFKFLHTTSLQFFTGSVLQDKVRVTHGQQIFEGDALLGWKLIPNLNNAFWDFTTVSTNNQGLRYYKNISKKTKNTVRIITLGDSITFGYRLPLTFPNDPLSFAPAQASYPLLVENYLKNKNPDKNIEVIPMAVPGYTTYQGLKWLERDIRSLKPDLVTILFGWNDTEQHSLPDKETLPDNWLAYRSREIMSRSQALIYFGGRLHGSNNINNSLKYNYTPRVSEEDFVNNILAMNELAAKYNAKTIIIGSIYMDNQSNNGAGILISKYRSALRDAAQLADIPYFEIEQLTPAGYPANTGLFGEPIHPNFHGHQLIANRLLEFISKKTQNSLFLLQK